jgi:SpoVK/Ycf46/Vps4 family AAA+-type ATPase
VVGDVQLLAAPVSEKAAMRNLAALQGDNVELPKGIQRSRQLPDPGLGTIWDSIVLDETLKTQLLSQAVLNFTIRGKVSRTVLPLHGVILLVGEPGTGKTSLARGLAHRTALAFSGGRFRLLEVEPHTLTSSAMGKTQRAVSDLFSQAIAEAASQGPTIVLLDEVETLAADRSKMSLDANPIDIHRATDAVLVQLDALADRVPELLFVATSNFPDAVDSAFTSRCDLVLKIPLPDREACGRILKDCLTGLGQTFPSIGRLASAPGFDRCAAECVGLDGRAIRKMVANALASSPQTAIDPDRVTLDNVFAAAKAAKVNRTPGARSK